MNRYKLQEEFAKHGIDFVYNDRQRAIYLKIKGAPVVAEGVQSPDNSVQLTGWYRFWGGIRDCQDVPTIAQETKDLFREKYANNPEMLKYLDAAVREPLDSKISEAADRADKGTKTKKQEKER